MRTWCKRATGALSLLIFMHFPLTQNFSPAPPPITPHAAGAWRSVATGRSGSRMAPRGATDRGRAVARVWGRGGAGRGRARAARGRGSACGGLITV